MEPDARAPRRRVWGTPVALGVVAFVVYAITSWNHPVSFDVYSANLASWRIATSGVPWFDGMALPGLDESPIRFVWVLEGPNGHTLIGRSPGVIAAGLPAYGLLGQGDFGSLPGALTASAMTAATLVLLYVTLRRMLGRARSLVAVAIFGFATPVWSVAANGIWPHTVTVFGIAGMVWATDSRRWWLVGLFGGITLWGRLHAAVIVAIVGLFLSWRRRDPAIALQVGAVSGAFLGLVCAWCRWMYGSWNPTASYDTSAFVGYAEDHKLGVVNQLGMWVSPDRGILLWTPLILLILPSLRRSWSRQPDWTKVFLGAGVFYTLLQASLNRFSGGDQYYGYRLTLELLVCALPALVVASQWMGAAALRLVYPVVAIQLVAIGIGAVHDNALVIDSRDAWTGNGFLLAFQTAPVVVGAIVAVALSSAVLLNATRWSLSTKKSPPLEERDPMTSNQRRLCP